MSDLNQPTILQSAPILPAQVSTEPKVADKKDADNKTEVKPTWKQFGWWLKPASVQIYYPSYRFIIVMLLILVISLFISTIVLGSTFENKNYDPFGTGIRFSQSRDDTGSINSSLKERQVNNKPLIIEPLTSNPEPPTLSEYYGVEANLKDGRVMIDRENLSNKKTSKISKSV